MKTAPYRGLSLGLAFALLLVFAQPAAAHRLKTRDIEPDYVLYGVALILYPIGDALDHVLFGPHEKDASTDESLDEKGRRKPRQNFSPRKKRQQEHSEQIEKEEQ